MQIMNGRQAISQQFFGGEQVVKIAAGVILTSKAGAVGFNRLFIFFVSGIGDIYPKFVFCASRGNK